MESDGMQQCYPNSIAKNTFGSTTGMGVAGCLVTYSVILPTYNERINLPLLICVLLNTFKSNNLQYEILVVDDNSPDGTAEIFEELKIIYPNEKIKILQRDEKRGLGSAYIDGLKEITGDFVFIIDADFSHHPKFIPDFVKKQKEKDYDVVSGSRYIPGGGIYGWDMKRKFVSRVANFLAKILLNTKASDLTGSYRLYKRNVLEAVMPHIESYVFQMEIMTRLEKMNYSTAEIPITFVDRIYGSSKLGGKEIVQYARGLLHLFWNL